MDEVTFAFMALLIKKMLLPIFGTSKAFFNFDMCHVSLIFTNMSMFPTPTFEIWNSQLHGPLFDAFCVMIVFELACAIFYHVLSGSHIQNPHISIFVFN